MRAAVVVFVAAAAAFAAPALSPPAHAQGTAGVAAREPKPPPAVAHYRLEVVDAPDDVAEAIERQTLIGRWRTRTDYDPDQFAALYARLPEEALTILQAAGYFGAEVKVTGDPSAVRVEVSAGARTTVNQVTLRLGGELANDGQLSKQIQERWALPEGSFFTASSWTASKRALIETLRQRGYLRAQLTDSQASVDVQNTSVALEIVVDSGPAIAFGPLRIKGLSRYQASLVENLRPFEEGSTYSFDQVVSYQTRLRDAGWFTSANVLPDLTALDADPALGAVPIDVVLVERQEKRVTLGLGYSTDQGPRTQVGYENFNFLERGWLLQSGVIVEGLRQRAFATVRTPPEPRGHYWMFGSRYDKQNIEGERISRATTFIGRGRRTEQREYFASLQYQVEQSAIEQTTGDLSENISRALVLGYSWNLRRIDSRLDPRSGYTISAQVSGASRSLLSDRTFGRVYTRAMRFLPMPEDSPLKGGFVIGLLELGAVIASSRDDIPSENLFRAGGAQSLRGYSFQGLGVASGNATVGGRYLAIGSLEYQHPVAQDWRAAVFYDRGNATDTLRPFNAVAGYGVGARWRSPIGPLNLDLAYGQAERAWRVHFSIGYTF